MESTSIHATDVWLGRRLIPAWFIDETFKRQRGVAPTARIATVVDAIHQNVGIHYNHDLTTRQCWVSPELGMPEEE